MKKTNQTQPFTSQQRWILGLTAGASFIAALDGMVVTTALNDIHQNLNAPMSSLHWTMTAYSLAFAALLIAGAALGDRYGRRRIFILGLLLFALSSIACAAANSIELLIIARIVQGAASALLVPLAMSLLGAAMTPAQRPRAMGLFGGLTGLAVLSGPVIGGAIVDSVGWRWVFGINVPLCLAAAQLARRRLPEGQLGAAQIDWPGVALSASAMTALVWGLSQGNAAGWSSRPVAASLAFGAITGIGFLLWQFRSKHALVPSRLLRSSVFRSGNIACLLLFMSMMGTLVFMAQFFQIVHGVSASGAGGRMLPWTVSLFAMMPVAGALSARFGERPLTMTGMLLQAVGLFWMSRLTGVEHPYSGWIFPMILAGGGIALAIPALQSAVLGAVAPGDMGKASGVFNTMRQLGWACGAAAAVAVFSRFGNLAQPQTVSGGFSAVLNLTAGLSAMGAVVAMNLGRSGVKESVSESMTPLREESAFTPH